MATSTRSDESLVERDEVIFPDTSVIDTEPHYDNFTAIQNALRFQEEERQANINTNDHRRHSGDGQYRAVYTPIEPSSSEYSHFNEASSRITEHHPFNSSRIPVNIQSKKIDGHIFNLIQIVEDIGYDKNTPFLRSSPNANTKNISALLDIVLKMGGAHGPLVNVWRSRINNDYFQRWYLEKYNQNATTTTTTTETRKTDASNIQMIQPQDYQSNLVINNLVSMKQKPTHQSNYSNEIKQIYGYDEVDTSSPISTSSSFNEMDTLTNLNAFQQRSPSIKSVLKTNNNDNHSHSSINRHVTIREQYPTHRTNQSTSSQYVNHDQQHLLSDYQQLIQNHPHFNNDPNPEIITKSNPDQVTYKQNISVRYLVPPTPPPPGPLIIREIVPPRLPTPPPLVIKHQNPSPLTPPPLILREAPPLPPPSQQEPTILTKILQPEPPSSQRVIVEHSPPLPPKPQSIIIEKWLPYKTPPPREVIHERVTENSTISEFEPNAINLYRPRRHSAEFHSNSSDVFIPVNSTQRRSSVEYLDNEQLTEQPRTTFDELAWRTHQQILALQQQGREQVQAQQQWAANQWQQHANMFTQYSTPLTTPALIVYHPPVTMNPTSYVQTQEYRQRVHYNPTFMYPYY